MVMLEQYNLPCISIKGRKIQDTGFRYFGKNEGRAIGFQMDSHVFENCGHVPSLMDSTQIEVILSWLNVQKINIIRTT